MHSCGQVLINQRIITARTHTCTHTGRERETERNKKGQGVTEKLNVPAMEWRQISITPSFHNRPASLTGQQFHSNGSGWKAEDVFRAVLGRIFPAAVMGAHRRNSSKSLNSCLGDGTPEHGSSS